MKSFIKIILTLSCIFFIPGLALSDTHGRVDIKKLNSKQYSIAIYDDQSQLIWSSTKPMSASDILNELISTFGYSQLDAFHQLSVADPERFSKNNKQYEEVVTQILQKNESAPGTIQPELVTMLKNWLDTRNKVTNVATMP